MRSRPLLARPARHGASEARSGFALVEVVVATGLLMLGLFAISSTTWRVHALRAHTSERRIADNQLRSIVEEIRSFSAIARREPETWSTEVVQALRPGGEIGDTFEVEGLTPSGGAAAVGSILVVVDETSTDDALGVQLGLPRDLNGDGDDDDTDVGAEATLLPIVIRLQWRGKNGDRELVHPLHLSGF